MTLNSENQRLFVASNQYQARINQAAQCDVVPRQEALACQPPPTDDVLLLVDASTSMGWDYGSDGGGVAGQSLLDSFLQGLSGQSSRGGGRATGRVPSRMAVARDAMAPLASQLAPNTKLQLLSFAECRRQIRREGVFSSADDQAYKTALNRLRLRDKTALAEAIDQLPNMTEAGRTPDRPVTIVIVSDGEDVCGGNPCAAAARLRQKLPHSYVSVVSLAKAASANACIADATDGRFLAADDTDALALAMRRTLGQLSREECTTLLEVDQ